MTHQAVRLSISPCIKSGEDNTVLAVGSQEPAKVSGTAPAPIVMSPANRPSYKLPCHIYVDSLGQSHEGFCIVGSGSVSFYESGQLFLWVFL